MHRRQFTRVAALSACAATLGGVQQAPGQPPAQGGLKIALTSVLVDNQDKALKFYTEVLGFVKKTEVPLGEFKWLTVVAPAGPAGVELLLEPTGFDFAKTFQQALYEAGIPQAAFAVDDIDREFARLEKLGVKFRGRPAPAGPVKIVLLEDTCGNLLQLYQLV